MVRECVARMEPDNWLILIAELLKSTKMLRKLLVSFHSKVSADVHFYFVRVAYFK